MYSHQSKGQMSCGKLILLNVVPLVVNGGIHNLTQFPRNTCQKMRDDKHVKVKKQQRQAILRFQADARKIVSGSTGTPLTT